MCVGGVGRVVAGGFERGVGFEGGLAFEGGVVGVAISLLAAGGCSGSAVLVCKNSTSKRMR